MKVKVLRDHGSIYGAKYHKKKGQTFDHRDPAADIAAGNVAEDVKPAAKKPKAPKKPAATAKAAPAADLAAASGASLVNGEPG